MFPPIVKTSELLPQHHDGPNIISLRYRCCHALVIILLGRCSRLLFLLSFNFFFQTEHDERRRRSVAISAAVSECTVHSGRGSKWEWIQPPKAGPAWRTGTGGKSLDCTLLYTIPTVCLCASPHSLHQSNHHLPTRSCKHDEQTTNDVSRLIHGVKTPTINQHVVQYVCR